MDLALDPTVAEGYSSKSQRSRVITETWAAGHLYCLNCSRDHIEAHRPGKRVEDFLCPSCDRRTQLKAARGGHGRTVSNSAYEPKMAAIRANAAPDYAFMGFDPDAWQVTDLFLVPGHFMTPSVVEARKPLRSTAQRAAGSAPTSCSSASPTPAGLPSSRTGRRSPATRPGIGSDGPPSWPRKVPRSGTGRPP